MNLNIIGVLFNVGRISLSYSHKRSLFNFKSMFFESFWQYPSTHIVMFNNLFQKLSLIDLRHIATNAIRKIICTDFRSMSALFETRFMIENYPKLKTDISLS